MAMIPGAAPTGPPAATPPVGPSPVSPPPQPGLQAQAQVKLKIGVKSLIEYLGMIGNLSSDESKAVVDALKTLSKVTPDASEAVTQSEMASLAGGAQAVAPGAPRPPGPPQTMLGTGRPMPQPVTMGMR